MFLGFYLPQNYKRTKEILGDTVSVFGDFIDLGNTSGVKNRLLSSGNDIPFVNIMIGNLKNIVPNLKFVSDGLADEIIREFSMGIKNSGKKVFLALTPEMNGKWTEHEYGVRDSQVFKSAYIRFRKIVLETVSENNVHFVFAPNGWSEINHIFENYYPGDDFVDSVGLSVYGSGFCDSISNDYQTRVGQYVDRAINMTNGKKPILLVQFARLSDKKEDQSSLTVVNQKFQWLKDVTQKLSLVKEVKGYIYFNVETNECGGKADYRIIYPTYHPTGINDVSFTKYFERSADALFSRRNRRFDDVSPKHPSLGDEYIHNIQDLGIMGGTSVNPPLFNPSGSITRAAMCVIALRIKRGSKFVPSTNFNTTNFPDVQKSHWGSAWINQAVLDGIIGGFPDGTFRPDEALTRSQFSVMFLRSKFGNNYKPPSTTNTFADCSGHWGSNWIQDLSKRVGYVGQNFYPDSNLLRSICAEWVVKGME